MRKREREIGGENTLFSCCWGAEVHTVCSTFLSCFVCGRVLSRGMWSCLIPPLHWQPTSQFFLRTKLLPPAKAHSPPLLMLKKSVYNSLNQRTLRLLAAPFLWPCDPGADGEKGTLPPRNHANEWLFNA